MREPLILKDKDEYFGIPSTETMEHNPELQKDESAKIEFDIEDTVEKIKLPPQTSWIVLWIALGAVIGAAIFTFKIFDIFTTLGLLALSIILNVKINTYEVNAENKHYMRNLAHTLKAFFIRVLGFKMFYVNRKRNAIIATVVLFVEQPFLRAWLYYPISASIHYTALILLVLSLAFMVSSKEPEEFSKLTSFISMSQSVSLFLIFVFFRYLSVETILLAMGFAVLSKWSLYWIQSEEENKK